jgi:subtilisin family serine protease
MGTVVGNNVGMAPEAQWIGCRNMRDGIGNPGSYVECMEFFFAPYPHGGDPFLDGDPAMAPHIVNNSWGCPPEEGCVDPEPIRTASEVLRAAGILMVVSAGNEGPDCNTVWIPASEDSVLAVGASNENQDIVSFSSRGPTDDGLVKPDVAAPGVNVISSIPGDSYSYAGGTSMAGPHVAGLVVLLWSAQPDLIGDIDLTEQIIITTAHPYLVESTCPADGQVCACGQDQADLTPNNVAGYGIVDAQSAVESALNR